MTYFARAVLEDASLCMAIVGGPGTGKTYTALSLAAHLGERVCLIDGEYGRAALYANEFAFDMAVLPGFHPKTYIQYINAAEAQGYDVIIVDGISPEWDGIGGCLQLVDDTLRRGADKARAWAQITPLHDRFIKALLRCRAHLIVTLHAKERYIIEKDADGRQRVSKVGVGVVQQERLLYSFPIIGSMDGVHNLQITKTCCHELRGAVIHEPGEDLARILLDWMSRVEPGSTARPRAYSEAEVRAAMGAAVRAGRWTMPQITALMHSLSADSIEVLEDAQRRRVVQDLTTLTGQDWLSLSVTAPVEPVQPPPTQSISA